jgi:hypothetical protein
MSAYAIAKICYLVQHDPGFRADMLEDPGKAVAPFPLSRVERQALLAGDVAALQAAGVHPILLNRLHRYGAVGLTAERYARRMQGLP